MSNSQKKRFGTTSIFQLFRERSARDNLYHSADYWDARAHARSGLARSIWPSNVFNELWDRRQRELLSRTLGDVHGHRMADVGCGTGRMSRFFASQGAEFVLGLDFSPETVEAARSETHALSFRDEQVQFAVGDVLAPLTHAGENSFDDVVVLGCLSVACRELDALYRALGHVAKLAKIGGRVLLLEPIHRSKLLRRVLRLGIEEWIAAANHAGLSLIKADRMGFAPVRLFASVRDLPMSLVEPIFQGGEWLLDKAPTMAPLSDYKLLMFERHR